MVDLTAFQGHHVLAVAVAAVGAVLFGLASVRQHGSVQQTLNPDESGFRDQARALGRLVRQPSWLIGSVQSTVAAGLHVVALALAPITLVQPVGVLAVPVTVVATAIRSKRRPSRRQVIGAVLSVAGIAVLTVLLLAPSVQPLVLPSWGVVAATVVVTVGATAALTVSSAKGPRLLRCVALATGSAVLFGLNSILIRMIGHIVSTDAMGDELALLVCSVSGLVLGLAVGSWAMQAAFLSGSPHVVICCLTLVDPLTAVGGGYLLLQDGVAASPGILVVVAGCALLAAAGVVLLSAEYPVEELDLPVSASSSAPIQATDGPFTP